jgi:hypothetical protein
MSQERSQVELLAIEAAHEITLENLDQALVRHASLFEEITRNLPELRMNTEITKVNRDTARANQSLTIRDEATRAGRKTTEASVEAEILLSEEYQIANDAYISARYEQDIVERARDVMASREKAIAGLISLYVAQYWSVDGVSSLPKAVNEGAAHQFKKREK